jgi:hypothetical protein
MTENDTQALVDRIKALEAKVAAQTPRVFAPRPYAPAVDHTERMMSEVQPWMREMAAVGGDTLVRDIVADNQRSASAHAPAVEAPKARGNGTGWQEQIPLRRPEVVPAVMWLEFCSAQSPGN